MAKSGMTATQKATKKGRPLPSPPPEEEQSVASSRIFYGWTACDARRSESSAPVTVAAGAMGCGEEKAKLGGVWGRQHHLRLGLRMRRVRRRGKGARVEESGGGGGGRRW